MTDNNLNFVVTATNIPNPSCQHFIKKRENKEFFKYFLSNNQLGNFTNLTLYLLLYA